MESLKKGMPRSLGCFRVDLPLIKIATRSSFLQVSYLKIINTLKPYSKCICVHYSLLTLNPKERERKMVSTIFLLSDLKSLHDFVFSVD